MVIDWCLPSFNTIQHILSVLNQIVWEKNDPSQEQFVEFLINVNFIKGPVLKPLFLSRMQRVWVAKWTFGVKWLNWNQLKRWVDIVLIGFQFFFCFYVRVFCYIISLLISTSSARPRQQYTSMVPRWIYSIISNRHRFRRPSVMQRVSPNPGPGKRWISEMSHCIGHHNCVTYIVRTTYRFASWLQVLVSRSPSGYVRQRRSMKRLMCARALKTSFYRVAASFKSLAASFFITPLCRPRVTNWHMF